MSSFPFLDLVVLVVMLLSALLAMVRGFTREVLAITAWVVAIAAALYFKDDLAPWIAEHVTFGPDWLPMVIAGTVVFLVTLIVVSLVTIKIADLVLDSQIGPVDRSLGFLFGAARGFLLAVIAFIFFNYFVSLEQQPDWATEARSRPILEASSKNLQDMLASLLPEDLEESMFRFLRRAPGENEPTVVPDGDAPPALEQAPPASGTQPNRTL